MNIGESLLRGAEEALAYAKGQKKGHKTHKVKILKQEEKEPWKTYFN